MDLYWQRSGQYHRAGHWRWRCCECEEQHEPGAVDGWRCVDHRGDCATERYDGSLWVDDPGFLSAEKEGEDEDKVEVGGQLIRVWRQRRCPTTRIPGVLCDSGSSVLPLAFRSSRFLYGVCTVFPRWRVVGAIRG